MEEDDIHIVMNKANVMTIAAALAGRVIGKRIAESVEQAMTKSYHPAKICGGPVIPKPLLA